MHPQSREARSASSRALSTDATHENSPPKLIPNCSAIRRAFGAVPGPRWKSQDAPASEEAPDRVAIAQRKSGRRREDELMLLRREESRAKILKADRPMRRQARSGSFRSEQDSVNLSPLSLSRAPANSSRLRINTKAMLRAKGASISSVEAAVSAAILQCWRDLSVPTRPVLLGTRGTEAAPTFSPRFPRASFRAPVRAAGVRAGLDLSDRAEKFFPATDLFPRRQIDRRSSIVTGLLQDAADEECAAGTRCGQSRGDGHKTNQQPHHRQRHCDQQGQNDQKAREQRHRQVRSGTVVASSIAPDP